MKKVTNTSLKKQILEFDLEKGRVTKVTTSTLPSPKAVIYCRVSDQQQVTKGNGLISQADKCKEWCSKQGTPIEVVKVFEEPGVSGASLDRPALNDCIAFIKNQNKVNQAITHFVISEASRLSRPEDIAEAFQLEDSISSLGVKIIKVDSPGIDEETDEGKFLKTIMYAVSGFERKKISQRALNGKVSRLKNGYRPFNKPPLGYLRQRNGPKDYSDTIEPISASILREGLEMFASGILETQNDLWKFRVKKGLRPNSKQRPSKKLWKTFPEKVFQLHRLFFYAGYIYYPKWNVNEPFKGKHPGIIDIKTVYTIIKRLKKSHIQNLGKTRILDKMSDEFPLKGAITCAHCKRYYTAWTTSRYRDKNGVRTVKRYPYYGCMNPDCSEKPNVPKSQLESDFESLLENGVLQDSLSQLVQKLFNEEKDSLGILQLQRKSKQIEFDEMTEKQEKIERMMMECKNTKLLMKFENDWEKVEDAKDKINKYLSEEDTILQTLENLLSMTKKLFQNPVSLWRKIDPNYRKLFFKVLFGDHLPYSKKLRFKTLETIDKNCIYGFLLANSPLDYAARFENKTEPRELIADLNELLKPMEDEITQLHAVLSK